MAAACAGLVLLPALHAEVGQRTVVAVVEARNELSCAAAFHPGAVAWPAAASLAALSQPLARWHNRLMGETSGATSDHCSPCSRAWEWELPHHWGNASCAHHSCTGHGLDTQP